MYNTGPAPPSRPTWNPLPARHRTGPPRTRRGASITQNHRRYESLPCWLWTRTTPGQRRSSGSSYLQSLAAERQNPLAWRSRRHNHALTSRVAWVQSLPSSTHEKCFFLLMKRNLVLHDNVCLWYHDIMTLREVMNYDTIGRGILHHRWYHDWYLWWYNWFMNKISYTEAHDHIIENIIAD